MSKLLGDKITGVTVFTDNNAQIVKELHLEVKKGINKFVVPKFPNYIDGSNIIIALTQGRLVDYHVFRPKIEETEDIKKLKEDIKRTKKELESKKDDMSILKEQNDTVAKLVTSFINTKNENVDILGRGDELIKFQTKELERLRTEGDKLKASYEFTEKKLQDLEVDLKKMYVDAEKLAKELHLEIAIDEIEGDDETTEVGALVTYIVNGGASWSPQYNIHFDKEKKKMKLSYNASLKQTTGENWEGVELKLSTAKINSRNRVPELMPWTVGYTEELGLETTNISNTTSNLPHYSNTNYKFKKSSRSFAGMPSTDALYSQSLDVSESERAVATAESVNEFVNVFTVIDNRTIESGNKSHKVTIAEETFDVTYKYVTVPRLGLDTYLVANTRNQSSNVLLSGECNIYMNSNFVAKTTINNIFPNQKFDITLANDNSIKVKRVKVKKENKLEENFVKKNKNVVVSEYLITVTNNKSTKERILVMDQIPKSSDTSIEIKLLQGDELDEATKRIKWDFELEPKQDKEIKFAFSITYPEGKEITF